MMKQMRRWLKKKRKQGFTIMELLVVFAVLGVVSTGGVFVATTQVNKANDTRRKQDLQQLRQAFEHYYSDFGMYPAMAVVNDCGGVGLDPYLEQVPCDPVTKQPYFYEVDATGQIYKLYAKLSSDKDTAVAEAGCQTGCGPGGAFNYGVASEGTTVGVGSTEEGVTPECGGAGNWYCFANVCGECCPGAGYRCNGAGTKCIVDTTCGN